MFDELGEDMPESINVDVGYYGKCSSKCWLVTKEDLDLMYANAKTEEISLWCDAGCSSGSKTKRKRKKSGGTSVTTEEQEVDEHDTLLTEKHGESYSVPQRCLWAL